jgi:hypothetical protein
MGRAIGRRAGQQGGRGRGVVHGEEEGGGGRGSGGYGKGRELHITHTWVAWRGDVVMGLVSWETMMVVAAATAGSLACIDWQAGGRGGKDCHAA